MGMNGTVGVGGSLVQSLGLVDVNADEHEWLPKIDGTE